MKIDINRCYGGFGISDACARALGLDENDKHEDILRGNTQLIAMVEQDSSFASDKYAKLEVVEIPNTATDWELSEYDGYEHIIAVIDGKIVHL